MHSIRKTSRSLLIFVSATTAKTSSYLVTTVTARV